MNPGYGLAEATLAVTVKPRHVPPLLRPVCSDALAAGRIAAPATPERSRMLVSSGVFHGDTDIRIVDPVTHQTRGRNETGEIWVTGAGIPAGY